MRQDDPFVSRRGVLTGPAGLSSSAIADKGGQFILIDALGVRAHTDGEDTMGSGNVALDFA
jgi:hypothetical protein